MGRPLSAQDLLDAARVRIHRHSPAQALQAQSEGAIILDLRCGSDRTAEGSIPDSLPIALSVLPWRVDPASPSRDERLTSREATLILVCNDGFSSSLAAANLIEMGFANAGDLEGGYRAWAAAGLPVESDS
ncbi:MAG: rhodanese-like domain-containing protein [Acidimicrobiia bacterium]|nr:MAG: rhodanese-like domain-containing protein [Acidimicrobiia bacterium]